MFEVVNKLIGRSKKDQYPSEYWYHHKETNIYIKKSFIKAMQDALKENPP